MSTLLLTLGIDPWLSLLSRTKSWNPGDDSLLRILIDHAGSILKTADYSFAKSECLGKRERPIEVASIVFYHETKNFEIIAIRKLIKRLVLASLQRMPISIDDMSKNHSFSFEKKLTKECTWTPLKLLR